MPSAPSRERRSWTAKEDQLLREAVEKEDPHNPNPSKWHAIAKHVPNRTNKDCRKRWFAKMASDVVKGGWSPEEDERLVKGIKVFGTRWSQVASVVQTRNSDQCAKRWTDTLNPSIDRSMWTPEADRMLLKAVEEHGKVWTKIVKTYFPGRTGLSAKNRYNSITRYNSEHSRCRDSRGAPESPRQLMQRRLHTASPDSSTSSPTSSSCHTPVTPSPITPSISLMSTPSSSTFHPSAGDAFHGWHSATSSPLNTSFGDSLPLHQNYVHSRQITPHKSAIVDHSFPSFDNALEQTFPQYVNTHATFQNPPLQEIFCNTLPQSPLYASNLDDANQLYSQAAMTSGMPNQFAAFGPYHAEIDQFISLAWEGLDSLPDTKQSDPLAVAMGNESSFIF